MKYKWIQQLLCLLLFLFAPLLTLSTSYASESSGSIYVERNFTDDDKFTLEIQVKEGGYVIDGNTRISTGTVAYEVPLETFKTFEIYSLKGYKLKDITYEQPEMDIYQSILSELHDNKITVQSLSTKVIVSVAFEKTGEWPGIDTGDTTSIGIFTMTCISSLVVFFMVMKKKKEKDTYKAQ